MQSIEKIRRKINNAKAFILALNTELANIENQLGLTNLSISNVFDPAKVDEIFYKANAEIERLNNEKKQVELKIRIIESTLVYLEALLEDRIESNARIVAEHMKKNY